MLNIQINQKSHTQVHFRKSGIQEDIVPGPSQLPIQGQIHERINSHEPVGSFYKGTDQQFIHPSATIQKPTAIVSLTTTVPSAVDEAPITVIYHFPSPRPILASGAASADFFNQNN